MVKSADIPADVVAVESDSRGYLFYVDKKGQLAYLLGPQNGEDFTSVVIKDAVDKPVLINPAVNQIAAISWVNPSHCGREIRVYYSAKEGGYLSEVFLTNEGKWTEGALHKKNKFAVKAGSSISATVTRNFEGKPTGIKVYAAKDGETNQYDIPNISLFKTEFGKTWVSPVVITSEIDGY